MKILDIYQRTLFFSLKIVMPLLVNIECTVTQLKKIDHRKKGLIKQGVRWIHWSFFTGIFLLWGSHLWPYLVNMGTSIIWCDSNIKVQHFSVWLWYTLCSPLMAYHHNDRLHEIRNSSKKWPTYSGYSLSLRGHCIKTLKISFSKKVSLPTIWNY